MKYCNLRVFSSYSLFKSIIKIPDLVAYCKSRNIQAIGLCEEMNMFGFVEFSKHCFSLGIKPVFGCLLKLEHYGLIPFFIKNREGYEFLSYVLSQFYIRELGYIPLDDLKEQKGLICLAGGENSLFYSQNNETFIEIAIKKLREIFQDDLFIEIQPKAGKNFLIEQAINSDIPMVCTNPVGFLEPKDLEPFHALHCIGQNKRFEAADLSNHTFKQNFLHTEESISEIFDNNFSEGLYNSVVIAKKCNFIIEQSTPKIPKYLENGREVDENATLKIYAIAGLNKRLKKVPEAQHAIYFERLEKELQILESKNFSGYFLITSDFVRKAKELDIPVGPARGSGTGSLIAFAMEITDIDPIQFDLIFERFLNPARNAMPDFDIDFCPDRRKEVIDYLREKYGTYNVLQIITFGTMQAKGVIRDVCRVCSLSFRESDFISRLIPHDQINPVTLQQAIDLVPQLKKMAESPKYKKVFEISLKLEGLVRNFSKHAAGIILSDRPLWEMCPIFRDEKGDLIVQFDLQDAEYVGGIKFDFLGLKTLTMINETIKLIKKRHNIELNWGNIPVDDEKTFKLFKTGNLDGVFQFDGAGIRDVVLQLGPDNLEDLIVLNALFRPGPIGSIPSYIRRKHGDEQITFLHKLTESALAKTFGIMVYQEQVMKIAKDCAGYSDGEADLLRVAMGKKKYDEMKRQKVKFFNGSLANGIPENIAEQIFAQMNEFAGYGFNKSHSTPYAFIAYVCAYLKAHFSPEFFCCFLSEDMSNTEKTVRFIQNIKAMKIEILPPSILTSQNQFLLEGNAIRYALGALKNMGENFIDEVIINRNKKTPTDIYEFVGSNLKSLNKKKWESLVQSGALDCFSIPREHLIDSLEDIKQGKKIMAGEKWDYFSRLEKEKEIFGFFINDYVLPIYDTLQKMDCKTSFEFETSRISSGFLAGEISQLRRRRGKDQTFYAFAEIIDSAGIFYTAIFSKVLEKHAEKIKEGNFLIFALEVDRKGTKIRATTQDVFTIDSFLEKAHQIEIIVKTKEEIHSAYATINESKNGETSVCVNVENEETFCIEKRILDCLDIRKKFDLANLKIR